MYNYVNIRIYSHLTYFIHKYLRIILLLDGFITACIEIRSNLIKIIPAAFPGGCFAMLDMLINSSNKVTKSSATDV